MQQIRRAMIFEVVNGYFLDWWKVLAINIVDNYPNKLLTAVNQGPRNGLTFQSSREVASGRTKRKWNSRWRKKMSSKGR